MEQWTHNGNPFTVAPVDAFGFIYLITNTGTGQKYIGKKLFTKAAYKQVKGKRKKLRADSDWINYWGSGPRLQDDIVKFGKKQFTREILRLCKSRGECNYWESYEIFSRHALRSEEYYNDWISCKISRKHLIIED